MTDDKQPVADKTDAPAKPDAEVTESARHEPDALEKLVYEYEQATKAAPESPPEPKKDEPVIPERIRQLEHKLFEDDVNQTVTSIIGDMKIPHRAARGWLDQMAREKPAIAQAFLNKANDPRTWSRMEKVLAIELAQDFKAAQIDENATAEHDAVAAAVRGASAKVAAEPPPNFGSMTDAELRRYTREKFGF